MVFVCQYVCGECDIFFLECYNGRGPGFVFIGVLRNSNIGVYCRFLKGGSLKGEFR